MSRITVIGGTGYAGSAIVAEAAARGHRVTALSRELPDLPVPNVTYVQGDATVEATLAAPIGGADVVVGALAPRGPLAGAFRDAYRTIARLADAAGARLFVVGGYSSLRPAPDADRFVTDLSGVPAELHDEILAGAALIIEDLPATPATLDWVFVSPALEFGAHLPSERLRRYRLGDDIAVQPEDGGAISAADYALGVVDLIEKGEHHRAQVNLAGWAPTSK
ncbi:NAD(P)-dependent oxidoreductase [Leekyejoonella antrihumi]|uniref:NAD-dependent epimerase/dehydratase family protein n=1 Tax=Leekyejoonella antrihumi TaxID=1660198 RepID=A0A563DYD8_9MICO|nr:NAD(P)H-binding protein [Leekyejoonella antrihumi]TWP34992.1 NAD-dependent epimerase/dehydratase family protein [Leekyejoonella antrihumi]